MLTPLSEWHPHSSEVFKDEGQSLLMRILECMLEGELEGLSWEQILRCEPYIYTPDEFRDWCHELWGVEFKMMNDILGSTDIDWGKAVDEYMKFMVVECMSREDEALKHLSEQVKQSAKSWEDFKSDMDILINDPSPQAKARISDMVSYHKSEIKNHNKYIEYIENRINQ